MDELLMIGPAAKRVRISVTYLRLLSNMGKIPCQRAGQIRLYRVEDLDKLKATLKTKKRKRGKQ